MIFSFFFFNDQATAENYTLSLHDALPISVARRKGGNEMDGLKMSLCPSCVYCPEVAIEGDEVRIGEAGNLVALDGDLDRKSTRLNSSHVAISYAVFCLKKKTCHSVYPLDL